MHIVVHVHVKKGCLESGREKEIEPVRKRK